ncbi:MAG: hypothetical protein EZS28_036686, partial [Streblomastix strix]
MGPAVKFDLNSMMQNAQQQQPGQQQKQPYSTSNTENSQSSSGDSSDVTGGTIGLGLGIPGFQQTSPQIVSGSENNSPQMLIGDFSKQPMTGTGSQIQMMPCNNNFSNQTNLDEDEDEDKNKGHVRNLVTDQQWEDKLDQEIIKLQTAYKQLPSPIDAKFIFNIVLSLTSQVIILVVLIIVVVVFVSSYKGSTVNIIASGMQPPTYAQIQYITL